MRIVIRAIVYHMLHFPELLKSTELAGGRLSKAKLDFLEKDIDCEWREGDAEATFSRMSQILSTQEIQFLFGELSLRLRFRILLSLILGLDNEQGKRIKLRTV